MSLDLQNTSKLDVTYGLDGQEATFQLPVTDQNPVLSKSRQGALLEAGEATIKPEDLQQAIDKAKAEKEKADAEANTTVDKTDSDKIMGIPKTGFYLGLTVLVLVGGYFGYKKFIVKN